MAPCRYSLLMSSMMSSSGACKNVGDEREVLFDSHDSNADVAIEEKLAHAIPVCIRVAGCDDLAYA